MAAADIDDSITRKRIRVLLKKLSEMDNVELLRTTGALPKEPIAGLHIPPNPPKLGSGGEKFPFQISTIWLEIDENANSAHLRTQ